jgi:hypothetical protein
MDRLSGLEMDGRSSGFCLVAAFVLGCIGFSCSDNAVADKKHFKNPKLDDSRFFFIETHEY